MGTLRIGVRYFPKNINIKPGGLYDLLHFSEVKGLRFWDNTSIGKVYGRLRILTIIAGIPGVAAFLQLSSLDSYKIFLFKIIGGPIPGIFVIISPLEVSINGGWNVPTGDPYILLLTVVFLASFAVVAFLIWCTFFVRATMYTPGYDTFGDVKRAIRSLLPGTGKDRRMVTPEDKKMLMLGALIYTAIYVGIAIGFVLMIAKLTSNTNIALIAIVCLLLSAAAGFPLIRFMHRGLEPPEKQDYSEGYGGG